MILKNTPPRLVLFTICLFLFQCSSEKSSNPYPEKVLQISSEMAQDLSTKIRKEVGAELAAGLELSLWAADTLVNDPIAISVDEKGQIYYTLATRLAHSEFDIRGHRNWMTASISFQSVEDRRAFLRKTFSEPNEEGERFLKDLNEDGILDWRDLTVEKEQIWLVSDADQDGIADRSQLYIEDFHEEITDLANGVEYHDGEVYLSVGPDLWRIKDTDGDNIANEKTSISHGFAVHIGFGAHGMSGVTVGPQGRIWWGIGDIGMNVVDQEGKNWKYPNQGVIVRSDPDGSNFEVYAAGLRNTHEFVFDKYGNLISEDNDGDHAGERERLVYLINGSETGWRINWQFGKYTDPDNNDYKVWMDEKMGIPRWDGQAAYFLPPIQNYVNGPTGMVYNPGTALSEEWYDHFFIAEFRGTPANSPIHAFTLKPEGASFVLDTSIVVAKGLLPTGLDFGPDGALYFGDWIDGWGKKSEGRIWKLDVTDPKNTAIRKEVQQLILSDFSKSSEADLGQLLGHQDLRIRRKAQFELVKRGSNGLESFQTSITQKTNQLARVHAIWGIAQMARTQNLEYAAALIPLLKDEDQEIITQAIKMLGDVRYQAAGEALLPFLKHPSLRIQLHAAEALGRLEHRAAFPALVEMLERNNDQDAWLRHAGMIALSRLGMAKDLGALHTHDSKAVRIAAVVALRRMRSAEIIPFLQDSDEYIVTEAARAINDDFSIEAALPALADLLQTSSFRNEALIRRVINANLRVGESINLRNLVDYATKSSAPPAMRAEAIATISTWAKPSPLDRVDGRYRGSTERDQTMVGKFIGSKMAGLLKSSSPEIQIATARTIAKIQTPNQGDNLLRLVQNSSAPEVRTAALQALGTLQSRTLGQALESAIKDTDPQVRSAALDILPQSGMAAEKTVPLFARVLQTGSIPEQQSALNALANLKDEAAVALLSTQLDQLIAGKLPSEIHLDLLEALEKQDHRPTLQKLKAHQQAQSDDSPIAEYRSTLAGGDARRGHDIFYNHEAAQCVRCHSIFELGGNAGPGLKGLGERLSKTQILESMIAPSAALAKGYGVVALELKNKETISGTVLDETATSIKLKIGKADIREIDKNQISSRQDIPSSMPAMGSILTKREIRDLVAFLGDL